MLTFPTAKIAGLLTTGLLLSATTGRPAAAQSLTRNGAVLRVSNGASLYVAGSLTNAAGGILATDGGALRVEATLTNAGTAILGSGHLEVRGDVRSTGSVSGGSSTLVLSSAAAQVLELPTGTTLHRLTINNAASGSAVTVPNSLTVSGALTLAAGMVRTGATAALSLPDGATLVGEAAGRYVQGNLRVTRASVAGPTDFGLGVVLDGTGQALGSVTVTRTAGLQTPGLSYGQNLGGTAQGIDRVWTFVPTSQPTAAVPLTLSWPADDDNGLTDFSQAQLWQASSASGPWSPAGGASNAATRNLGSSTAVLGTFTVSNAANPLPVEFIRFTAERQGADARLRWTTVQEKTTIGSRWRLRPMGAASSASAN